MSIERFSKALAENAEIIQKDFNQKFKSGHWMWYVFPQLKGLGKSTNSIYYGIDGLSEAKEYYNCTDLKNTYISHLEYLLTNFETLNRFFSKLDQKKLHSSVTLFHVVDKDNKIILEILSKFFNNKSDYKTIQILNKYFLSDYI